MKRLYKFGLMSSTIWLFIVAFGFMSLSHKQEFLLSWIVYLSFAGVLVIPLYFIAVFIYYFIDKRGERWHNLSEADSFPVGRRSGWENLHWRHLKQSDKIFRYRKYEFRKGKGR